MWPANLAGSPKQQPGTSGPYPGVLRRLVGTFTPHTSSLDGDSKICMIHPKSQEKLKDVFHRTCGLKVGHLDTGILDAKRLCGLGVIRQCSWKKSPSRAVMHNNIACSTGNPWASDDWRLGKHLGETWLHLLCSAGICC